MVWLCLDCQTSALWTGLPVSLSQTMVVSRWFVMPMALISLALISRSTSALAMTDRVESQI